MPDVKPGGDRLSILFVCSSGGHLTQLLALRAWWENHDREWVTFDLPDATLRLAGESVMYGHHPTTRNALNLVRNTGMAVRMLTFGRRPDVIVSTGAGLALPFFVVGKLLRIPTVYLEVLDRFDTGTLTGRLCRPFADEFCVQVDEQTSVYPGACVIGPVL